MSRCVTGLGRIRSPMLCPVELRARLCKTAKPAQCSYAAADFFPAALAIAPHARSRSKSEALKPQSRSASSVCSPGRAGGRWIALGVRLKRGAGAGWITPFSSTKVPTLTIIRMARRLFHAEHEREADVAALHDAAPFVARLGANTFAIRSFR